MRTSVIKAISKGFIWRWIILGGLVAALAIGAAPIQRASAQTGEVKIKDAQLDIWPEYDDPKVLFMYMGNLDDSVSLPQEMSFWVPANSIINSACAIQPNGTHTNETYQLKDDPNGGQIITYKVSEKKFHIELYFNPFAASGADKTFALNFKTLNPIGVLQADVQQPLKATGFTIDPSSPSTSNDNKGFKYYDYTFNNLTADQDPIALNVSYTKSDPNPSIEKGSDTAGTSGSAAKSDPKVLMGFFVVIVGAIVGFYVYTKRTRQPQYAGSSYRAGRAMPARATAAASPRGGRGNGGVAASRGGGKRAAAGGFCSGCGMQLNRDDHFCPSCGKKSRLAANDMED